MNKIIFAILLITALVFSAVLSYSASLTYSSNLEVTGGYIQLKSGSGILYPDGTLQTSADNGSAVWGQITGLIENQTDLQNQLNSKLDVAAATSRRTFKNISTNGVTPTWHNQGNTWTTLDTFQLTFSPYFELKNRQVFYTDNIGINGSYLCNLGIFINTQSTPICSYTFSGSPFYAVYFPLSAVCTLPDLPDGVHPAPVTISIKHRSGNCTYGSYGYDSTGTTRQLMLMESR